MRVKLTTESTKKYNTEVTENTVNYKPMLIYLPSSVCSVKNSVCSVVKNYGMHKETQQGSYNNL